MWRTAFLLVVSCAALAAGRTAHGLDKQGSAHGGDVSGEERGFAISGSLLFGSAVYNPTYAARPDNTGHALLRLAPHADIDLIGSRLSIPIDVNLFSDRDRSGLGKLAPTELDLISGITSTWPLGPSALELGARVEGDFPIDRGSYNQVYGDVRGRWLFSLAAFEPAVAHALAGGDITGAVTLGWFAVNPSYAARPDNTGSALLRYAFHINTQVTQHVFFGLDAVLFTDRREHALVPSELDFTAELGGSFGDFTLHLAYERDMPVDRGGFVQHFLLLFATWDFSVLENTASQPTAAPGDGVEPAHG
ncbi:MAG: hypothetical protein ABW321_09115 [Polyangiales bacterium]